MANISEVIFINRNITNKSYFFKIILKLKLLFLKNRLLKKDYNIIVRN